jgi:hypothetical protein
MVTFAAGIAAHADWKSKSGFLRHKISAPGLLLAFWPGATSDDAEKALAD